MRQCAGDYPCEVWYQYFPGSTAVLFTGVPYSDKRYEVPTRNLPWFGNLYFVDSCFVRLGSDCR